FPLSLSHHRPIIHISPPLHCPLHLPPLHQSVPRLSSPFTSSLSHHHPIIHISPPLHHNSPFLPTLPLTFLLPLLSTTSLHPLISPSSPLYSPTPPSLLPPSSLSPPSLLLLSSFSPPLSLSPPS